MTKMVVFIAFWVSGCIFIEMAVPAGCWNSFLIFLGGLNYIVANAASNQCG